MTDPANKTLQELATRYSLHPELCDVYVEGDCDLNLLRWFFDVTKRHNVAVYPIRTVSIAPSDVLAKELPDNNRSRIITLALSLESLVGVHLRVTCVADLDFDEILGKSFQCPLLFFTDFTTMEMYAYSVEAVHKICRLLGRHESGEDVLAVIEPLLLQLFSLRLGNVSLNLGLHWIDVAKCCSVQQRTLKFDESSFVSRYLNTRAGCSARRKEYLETVRAYQQTPGTEPRLRIRGHDFIDVLAWYLSRGRKANAQVNADEVRRLLYATLEVGELSKQPLFIVLLQRTDSCQ